jgi:hypothetical protein
VRELLSNLHALALVKFRFPPANWLAKQFEYLAETASLRCSLRST